MLEMEVTSFLQQADRVLSKWGSKICFHPNR